MFGGDARIPAESRLTWPLGESNEDVYDRTMTVASAILARRMHLPAPMTEDVVCEADLRVTMDDGVVLLADRWVAETARERPAPTVLVRSPYGRKQFVGLLFGRLLAERGLQVLVQSVRGTFGSQGEFNPFDERADGLSTLAFIRAKPWHRGGIGMIGPSYLGLVQWAVAADAGDDLAALAIQVSASQFYDQTYAGGSMALETSASWLVMVAAQENRLALVTIVRELRKLPGLLAQLPLSEFDEQATGAQVNWYREALSHTTRDDPYWITRDYTAAVRELAAPVQLIGGWYDIFLPWMLEDYAALRSAGRRPQLVIGPWTHTSPALAAAGHREGIGWLRAHLLDDHRMVASASVRVLVTGERKGGGWRELEDWPPPGTSEERLWLAPGGRLTEQQPNGPAGVDVYRYDPSDPTPSLGGPVLLAREPVVDNRPLERRADVLIYSTDPLAEIREAIGPVRVALWVRASSPYFDLFARVCDVDFAGVSRNVCDALARISPERYEPTAQGVWRVEFDLWPIAHRFAAGHRIRLQVSSGAHPRYVRNPGTGEDPLAARALRSVQIELLHGPEHPSALVLARAAV